MTSSSIIITTAGSAPYMMRTRIMQSQFFILMLWKIKMSWAKGHCVYLKASRNKETNEIEKLVEMSEDEVFN